MNSTTLETALVIPKPQKIVVPFERGLAWRGGGGLLYLRKYDGCWQPGGLAFGAHTLIVERMSDAGGIWYAAHSVAVLSGQNVLREPTRLRWHELCRIAREFPAHIRLAESGHGGEFLQAVINAGGEGVCAFDLDAPWGEMFACKRSENHLCIVTGFNGGTCSVSVKDAATGQPRGNVPLAAAKCDRVRIGSVLKLNAFGVTTDGKLREARVDQDSPESWLVKY